MIFYTRRGAIERRRAEVQRFVEAHPGTSVRRVAKAVGVHEKTAQRDLEKLIRRKMVRKVSDKRWTEYHPAKVPLDV